MNTTTTKGDTMTTTDLPTIIGAIEDHLAKVAPRSAVTVIHDNVTGRPTGLHLSAAPTDVCPGCGQTVGFQPDLDEVCLFDNDGAALWVTTTRNRQHGCGATPPIATTNISLDDLADDPDVAIAAAIDRLRDNL